MDVWESLVSTAVLGTERQPLNLPPQQGPLGQMLARLQEQDPEHAVLAAAAAIGLYRKAGATLAVDAEPLPEPAPADGREECSDRTRAVLRQLLAHDDAEVTAQWFRLARGAGQRLPDSLLPQVIALGARRGDMDDAVRPVVGARGVWLARQNPAWARAMGDEVATEIGWASGDTWVRRSALLRMRRTDAAHGREILVAAWPTEAPKERAKLLECLKEGLGPEDEAFLESVLDDKRKEVREAAVQLLALLPGSRFVQRMIARVEPLLDFTPGQPARLFPPSPGRKPRLAVTLPETFDKAMRRDGIEEKPQPYEKLGEKAWQLFQMLGHIPPGHWCARWQTTPADLIEAAAATEWKAALLRGWVDATIRLRDPDWGVALFEYAKRDDLRQHQVAALVWALPQAYRDAELLASLKGPSRDALRINHVLSSVPAPWSDALADAVLARIVKLFASENVRRNHWNEEGSELTPLLHCFGRLADTARAEEFCRVVQAGLDGLGEKSYKDHWEKHAHEAMRKMQLRVDMHAAFGR